METHYWYCPDYRSYVKYERGAFYVIRDGKLVRDDFYDRILIGEIYTDEITEEEFSAHLEVSDPLHK